MTDHGGKARAYGELKRLLVGKARAARHGNGICVTAVKADKEAPSCDARCCCGDMKAAADLAKREAVSMTTGYDGYESGFCLGIDAFKHETFRDKLPLLVLAADAEYHGRDGLRRHDFKRGRKFHPIAHQTAGYACSQHYLWATVLTPRSGVAKKIKALSRKWEDSNVGCLHRSLDSVMEYRKDLVGMGVDCNHSWESFEEGIYPIDLTDENLGRLASDALPVACELDSLVKWPKQETELAGLVYNQAKWGLYVLGTNCD